MCKERKTLCVIILAFLVMAGIFLSTNKAFGVGTPSFTITSHSVPTTIKSGNGFGVKGVITSDVTINYVTAGVVDQSGQWVQGAYAGTIPNSKSYNLHGLDKYVVFNNLTPGSYFYRIWVRDTNGNSKFVVDQPFTVEGNGGTSSGSTMSTSDCSYPTTLKKGKGFFVKGTVKSDIKLSYVKVGVMDKAGNWIDSVCDDATIDAITFDLKQLDKNIIFNNLPIGEYDYKIYGKDSRGNGQFLLEKPFTVTGEGVAGSSFSINGESKPTSIKSGKGFGVKGTINSTLPLIQVTAGVVDGNGNWVSTVYETAKPNALVYDLNRMDNNIIFNNLSPGTYKYKVYVKDSAGKDQYLVDHSFTVTGESTSSFSLTGETVPTSIKQGNGFFVKGNVTSKVKLNYVTAGVTDENGSWVEGVYAGTNPQSTSFNLAYLDHDIVFNKLTKGTYYYRVWVRDENGNSKDVVNTKFTVEGGSKSEFSITGQTVPKSIIQGQGFFVKGKVSSSNKLTKVTAGVVDGQGNWVNGCYATGSPNGKTYQLSNLDNDIVFNKLAAGTYRYKVWASDNQGENKYLIDEPFTVSGFNASGLSKPTVIEAGNPFSIRGQITSPYVMTTAVIGIKNAAGDWLNGQYVTVSPGGTMYDVSRVDPQIIFNALPKGTYYYSIWIKDVNGQSSWILNHRFTVESSSPPTTTTGALGKQLTYNQNVISSIGKQPYSGPCGLYAMGYSRAILDGTFSAGGYSSIHNRLIGEYGNGTSLAYWSKAGGSSTYYSNKSSCYKEVYRQINQGKPCIISLYNPALASNHYVTVVGYTKGTTESNVSFHRLIILDPGNGQLRYMGSTGYSSYVSPQLIRF